RLSEEKGIKVLLETWRRMQNGIPLCIVGDGPLASEVSSFLNSKRSPQVQWLGTLDASGVMVRMQQARVLIQPSICFENFPLTILEAFGMGLPVIASRLGSTAELVRNGVVGLQFEPGNTADLAAKVEWAWAHPEEMARMGRAARTEYESKY